jgi:hypothetical protein
MRRLIVVLAVACALLGVGAANATAAPPTALKLAPETMNFGSVQLGSSLAKPLTILNRTDSTLYYESARWPNLQHPGIPFPYGIWNLSFEPFPCWEIDPKSSCTLEFGFTPAELGPFSSKFDMTYGDGEHSYDSNVVPMRGNGI